jgi:DNA-binding transcriptional regulator YdaS (Cro superfamily)
MTANDVRNLLSKACDNAGSNRAWAQTAGVSPAYVSDVLNARREPGPAILTPLGLEAIEERRVTYRKIRTDAKRR